MAKKGDVAEVKTCFVIAPIGDAGSETRRRSDQLLKHVIEPCAKECGYDAVRADRISEPGLITTQVLTHIIDAQMVVADLSEHNPNVFYELAIRHAVGKPFVQMIRLGERIPFDVAGMRTISVDHQDLDSVAEAKIELTKQIRAVEADPGKLHTPLSSALSLESLRASDQPLERLLADMAASIGALRSDIGRLSRRALTRSPDMIAPALRQAMFENRAWTTRIENPLNYIDPSRFVCRTHNIHPHVEGIGDGTVTVSACCESFLAEMANALGTGT